MRPVSFVEISLGGDWGEGDCDEVCEVRIG